MKLIVAFISNQHAWQLFSGRYLISWPLDETPVYNNICPFCKRRSAYSSRIWLMAGIWLIKQQFILIITKRRIELKFVWMQTYHCRSIIMHISCLQKFIWAGWTKFWKKKPHPLQKRLHVRTRKKNSQLKIFASANRAQKRMSNVHFFGWIELFSFLSNTKIMTIIRHFLWLPRTHMLTMPI